MTELHYITAAVAVGVWLWFTWCIVGVFRKHVRRQIRELEWAAYLEQLQESRTPSVEDPSTSGARVECCDPDRPTA